MNPQNSLSKELPKIIQTLFIVDKNRKYLFDVNENILIKKLKKMISSASGLNKVGLRLFHEGIEYTQYDESALNELFPNLSLIEFSIQYSYEQVDDLEEIINLKLKQCCSLHKNKYPYFYCFSCKKSICSDCLFNGEHNNHEIKEKYDYLQESKNLVELLFKDLKDIFNNTKEGSDDSVNKLKTKVKIQFFPQLVQMVNQIEQKMMNLILYFLEKEKGNYTTIENNVKLLKNHCEEGLDKLKKEIVIEDMMVDENIFLMFDTKFKKIGNEKEKFKNDIQKYKQFSENLFLIQSIIEKTYKEIYDFLNKYLTVTEFDDIKNKLNSQDISVIDKKIIFDKLLSNIKRKGINEIKNQTKDNNKDNEDNINDYYLRSKNKIKINDNKDMDIDNNNISNNINKENYIEINNDDNIKDNNDKNNNIKFENNVKVINNSDNNNNNLFPFNTSSNNNNNKNEPQSQYQDNNLYINKNDSYQKNNTSNNINIPPTQPKGYDTHIMNLRSGNQKISYGPSNYNYNYNYYNSPKNQQKTRKDSNQNNLSINLNKKEESEEVDEESIYEGQIYNIVCNIVPPQKQIILYDVLKDIIIRKDLNFSPLLGLTHFFSECAWVNNNNKLYILGGVDDFNISSKIFLEYDPIKNTLIRLPDSNFSHSRHSLFAYNDQIFVVGGDKLECERFDINKNEWNILPNIIFKQIYPVLYVHNDILYSFFGIDENIRKTDNVQKLNLKNNKAKWQKLLYKKNKCNLCVYGCGIAKIDDNSILFLGGMDDNGVRDESIQFDFNNLSAKKTEFYLEEKAYFKDSVLLRLSANDFGNFTIEETNPFLKIKFQFNVKKMTH